MIYNNPSERLQDMKEYVVDERKNYRMATVTSISNGRPYVRFYGEETASIICNHGKGGIDGQL